MILYHGSDVIVKQPDVLHSKEHLDFGVAFYTTTVKEQAERWAKRKAAINNVKKGCISIYESDTMKGYNVLDFGDNLESWIDFVCECRDGSDVYKQYDIIKEKVANDKVFRVVDMYRRGIWDRNRAIKEIRVYETYDQIAFISQDVIDKTLTFKESYEVQL